LTLSKFAFRVDCCHQSTIYGFLVHFGLFRLFADCVACRFIWLQVELQVGNSQLEEQLYDTFTQACIEAQKAAIFFPAVRGHIYDCIVSVGRTFNLLLLSGLILVFLLQCEDMFDDIYGMIGDYMVSCKLSLRPEFLCVSLSFYRTGCMSVDMRE
jgi:hypothetical protein